LHPLIDCGGVAYQQRIVQQYGPVQIPALRDRSLTLARHTREPGCSFPPKQRHTVNKRFAWCKTDITVIRALLVPFGTSSQNKLNNPVCLWAGFTAIKVNNYQC
jgi:hypothetical protein